MVHLGGFYIVDNQEKALPDPSVPYAGTMGDTMAHDGRMIFVWAKKTDDTPGTMTDSFLGKGAAREAFSRSAGTHSVNIAEHDRMPDEITELQGIAHASFSNNYGMNLAVGGFGKTNPGAGLILNNGKNGHMFAHILESNKKSSGIMLMGIEGSAPGPDASVADRAEYRNKLSVSARNLALSANLYLQKKGMESKVSGKTRTRIDIAKDVIIFTTDFSATFDRFMEEIQTDPKAKNFYPEPSLKRPPENADKQLALNSAYSRAFSDYSKNDLSAQTKLSDAKAIFSFYRNELSKPGADCSAMYVYSGIAASLLSEKLPENMKEMSVRDLFISVAKKCGEKL